MAQIIDKEAWTSPITYEVLVKLQDYVVSRGIPIYDRELSSGSTSSASIDGGGPLLLPTPESAGLFLKYDDLCPLESTAGCEVDPRVS